jgi:hypothetical protein
MRISYLYISISFWSYWFDILVIAQDLGARKPLFLHGDVIESIIHKRKHMISTNHKKSSHAVEYSMNKFPVNWLIMHYHKTGHDLIRKVFRPMTIELNVSFSDNVGPRRRLWNFAEYLGNVPYFVSGVHAQGGAEMHFHWANYTASNYKILHFVRDPFEYIISAYLYHSQKIAPAEAWIINPLYNPCSSSKNLLSFYVKELHTLNSNLSFMSVSIENIIQSCQNLVQKAFDTAKPIRKHNYAVLLRHLAAGSENAIDALRLEAYRSLISSEVTAGGDIFRMAINSVRAREAGDSICAHFSIDDLPYDDEASWKITYGKILDFLFNGKYPLRLKSMNDRDYTSVLIRRHLIDKGYQDSLSHGTLIGNSYTSSHITKNFISNDKRKTYRDALKADPELGPILDTFRKLVFPLSY